MITRLLAAAAIVAGATAATPATSCSGEVSILMLSAAASGARLPSQSRR